MKKLILLCLLIFTSFYTFGAGTSDNEYKIGKGQTSGDKTLKLGETRLIRSNEATGVLEFTNDGSLYKKIGSGSGAGGADGINILVNSSFEDGLGDWTSSGGTFSQETFTTGLEGNTKFGKFIASATGQYVETSCTAIPSSFSSDGMMEGIRFSSADTAGVWIFKVYDCDSGDVLKSSADIPSLSALSEALENLPIHVTDKLVQGKIRIESTAAGTIYFDKGYLGSNKGFIAGTYINKVSLSGNDGRAITANTESVYFSGSANGWTSGGDGSTFLNGNYYTVQRDNSSIEGVVGIWGSGSAVQAKVYVNNVYIMTAGYNAGVLTYGAFALHALSKGDKVAIGTSATTTLNTSATDNYLALIERSSDTSEAYNPEQADFFARATLGGATVTNVADGIPSDASLSLVNKFGSMTVTCTDFSQGTTVCPSGLEQLGIQLNIPVAGRIKICFEASVQSWSAGTSNIRVGHYQNGSDTLITLGDGIATASESGSVNSTSQLKSCSYFNIASVGLNTFKIYNKTADVASTQFLIERSVAENNREAIFTVELVSHNVSRPIIQNMVSTSLGAGIYSLGCSVDATGNFLTATGCSEWVSGTANPATGAIDYTMATKYSGLEVIDCQCTSNIGGVVSTNHDAVCNIGVDDIDALTKIRALNETTSGAAVNVAHYISCKLKR